MRRGAIGIVGTAIAAAGIGLAGAALLFAPSRAAVPAAIAARTAAPLAPSVAAPPVTAAAESPDASTLHAASPQDAGGVIVSLKRALTASEAKQLGLSTTSSIRGDRLIVAAAPAGVTASQYAARLAKSGLVDYAEPDYLLTPAAAEYSSRPNDADFRSVAPWPVSIAAGKVSPAYPKSWALHGDGSANFDQVWPALAYDKAGRDGAPNVRVAVIDTGFYFDQVDRLANVVAVIDECQYYWPDQPAASQLTTDTDVTPMSTGGDDEDTLSAAHGTMVASEIGQGTSNNIGSAGAAWDTRVDVYKIQGMARSGPLAGHIVMPDSALVKAIRDAVDDASAVGYRLVINMSLVEHSGSTGSIAVREAIAYARQHAVIVVAAAGNEGNSVVSFPARYPGVISVGAGAITGNKVTRASFSNYGTDLDILAPGEHIWGPVRPGTIKTLPGTITPDPEGVSGYDWWDGTSMAAPYVSSAAALLLRVEPSLTATEVETYLTQGAIDMGAPGRDNDTGWGRLNAQAAYLALATPQTTSDVRQRYADSGTIRFSVADRDSGTNVTTYYELDDWGVSEGRSLNTDQYDANPQYGLHRLRYWSVDSNGVVEDAHAIDFTVSRPDPGPPTTVWAGAAAIFRGSASVALAASDNAPADWGVAATYYRLDSGRDTTGTNLVVGSSGPHTLRYWSVDNAGNVETARVTTFTVAPLAARVTIARNTSAIKHGGHVHLSGRLTPARAGDTISIQVKMPGSHVWKNFTGLSKYYKRSIGAIDLSGLGTWSTLTYTLKTRGRYYFRAVYSGDSLNLSRAAATSSSVTVLVR